VIVEGRVVWNLWCKVKKRNVCTGQLKSRLFASSRLFFWERLLSKWTSPCNSYHYFLLVMLRTFQNQRQIARPFVCFRCLAKHNRNAFSNSPRSPHAGSLSRSVEDGRPGEVRRRFHAGRVVSLNRIAICRITDRSHRLVLQ